MPIDSAHTIIWNLAKVLQARYRKNRGGNEWSSLTHEVRQAWFEVALEAYVCISQEAERMSTEQYIVTEDLGSELS